MNLKHSLFLLFIFFNFYSIKAQSWELKKDKNRIEVYTRAVEGYKLNEFKGITTLNATVEEIEAAIRDVENHSEWVADCEKAELLEKNGNTLTIYSVTNAPFPVSDRDNVSDFEFKKDGQNLKVTLTSKPNFIEEKEDYVRIPFLRGYWLLEPQSDGKTVVTYQVHADPGGSIPTWLANATAVDNPFETLENLRDYLD